MERQRWHFEELMLNVLVSFTIFETHIEWTVWAILDRRQTWKHDGPDWVCPWFICWRKWFSLWQLRTNCVTIQGFFTCPAFHSDMKQCVIPVHLLGGAFSLTHQVALLKLLLRFIETFYMFVFPRFSNSIINRRWKLLFVTTLIWRDYLP